MNLKSLDKIPYMEKRALVSEACFMYRRIKMLSSKVKEHELKVSDIAKINSSSIFKSVSTFEIVLGLLNRNYYEIIEKEFINRDITPSDWYESKYSRSSFFRIKHNAVDAFLSLLFA